MRTRNKTPDLKVRDDSCDPEDYREYAISLIYRLPIADVVSLSEAMLVRVREFEYLHKSLGTCVHDSVARPPSRKKEPGERPVLRVHTFKGSQPSAEKPA